MQVPQRQRYLPSIEDHLRFRQLFLFFKQHQQISTRNIFHDKVYSHFLGEDIIHRNDKRVLDLKQNQLFSLDAFNCVKLNHSVFPYGFHSVLISRDLILHEVHFAKGAFADQFDYFEIIDCSWASYKRSSSGVHLYALTVPGHLVFLLFKAILEFFLGNIGVAEVQEFGSASLRLRVSC